MTVDKGLLLILAMTTVACASQPTNADSRSPWWPEETRATATLAPSSDLDKVKLEVQWSAPPLDDGVLTQLVLRRGEQTLHSVPANTSVLVFEIEAEAGPYHLFAQDGAGKLSDGLEVTVTQEMLAKVMKPQMKASPPVADPNSMEKMLDVMKVYEKPDVKP